MDSYRCEESCISRLLFLEKTKYCVSLFVKEGLYVDDFWLFSIGKNESGVNRILEYNIKTREFKLRKKTEEGDYISNDSSDVVYHSTLDVSNDGMRFEGSSLNHSPFGYGSLYNSTNELLYQGVMFGCSKECFGVEIYPGLDIVKYCGCYYMNERHGFGILYDRKGEILYEGYWLYGSTNYETSIVLKDVVNDRIVHSLIHELVIDEGCGNDYDVDLELSYLVHLERLEVRSNSFKNLKSLKISDNPVLKTVDIGKKNASLQYEGFLEGAFENVKTVVVSSKISVDW